MPPGAARPDPPFGRLIWEFMAHSPPVNDAALRQLHRPFITASLLKTSPFPPIDALDSVTIQRAAAPHRLTRRAEAPEAETW